MLSARSAGDTDSVEKQNQERDLLPARAHLPLEDTALWRNG